VTAVVEVGSTPVPAVPVYQDGEEVGTTNADGEVYVTMPERVGTMELSAERGPVAGTESVELPEPEVTVTSALLFPALPARWSPPGSGPTTGSPPRSSPRRWRTPRVSASVEPSIPAARTSAGSGGPST
jgi:hypothetical protein